MIPGYYTLTTTEEIWLIEIYSQELSIRQRYRVLKHPPLYSPNFEGWAEHLTTDITRIYLL